jgi:hypothetical protein
MRLLAAFPRAEAICSYNLHEGLSLISAGMKWITARDAPLF